MDEPLYHIPQQRWPTAGPGRLIVRARDPAALVAALAEETQPERIVAIQLPLDADSEPLDACAPGLPVELVMRDPASEYPLLYRHTNLLDNHPVRALVPVRPGFGKAVKVALSLDFAVRLEIGQPEPAEVDELLEILDFYLHRTTVAQPVEFFHGALLGFYRREPLPLWVVLEEEPQALRYIADDGAESRYGRLAGLGLDKAVAAPDAGLDVWIERVLASDQECRNCEFLGNCGGYFKWPRRDYGCAGIKRVFGGLRDAAAELRRDLAGVAGASAA
ncbi:MAG: hypothetical protein JNM60_02550 [Candidatus Competibacteraceae bacterium]|nr:hypothetical protein [Candidatus Competibacteraceae bacterium]